MMAIYSRAKYTKMSLTSVRCAITPSIVWHADNSSRLDRQVAKLRTVQNLFRVICRPTLPNAVDAVVAKKNRAPVLRARSYYSVR
jgi:hypothetical protein